MLVWLKLSDNAYGTPQEKQAIEALEDRLEHAITQQGVGEYDGNEVGEGWYRLFAYGPRADRLAEVVLPIIQSAAPSRGSYAVKRYGPPGSREVRIDL